jgi:hypothetical protein
MTVGSGAESVSVRARLAARGARVSAPLRGNRPYLRYFLANQISSTGTAMATGAVAYAVLQSGAGAAPALRWCSWDRWSPPSSCCR